LKPGSRLSLIFRGLRRAAQIALLFTHQARLATFLWLEHPIIARFDKLERVWKPQGESWLGWEFWK
jgi:hypothetical protein